MKAERLREALRRAAAFGPVYADMKAYLREPKPKRSRPRGPVCLGLAREILEALAERDLDTVQLQAACPTAASMSKARFHNNLAQLVFRGRVVNTERIHLY